MGGGYRSAGASLGAPVESSVQDDAEIDAVAGAGRTAAEGTRNRGDGV